MFWVSSCVEIARFDAIVVVESMVVDGIMPGLNCLILGFGITYVRSSGDIKIQKMSVRVQNHKEIIPKTIAKWQVSRWNFS